MAKMELGKRQVRVLSWIAENPNSHAKAIQEGIEYSQYGNINIDVKKLEKYGFLISKKEHSSEKRKRTVAKYRCTEKGVWYALKYTDERDIINTLKINKEYESINYFHSASEKMGETGFLCWFKDFRAFVPMLEKLSPGEIMGLMIQFYFKKLEKSNGDERTEMLKSAFEQFPDSKKVVEKLVLELTKALN